MRSTFLSAKEYRDFAAQCLRWAFRAKREEHKNMMLQMADHWMQTAQTMERVDTCVPSGARLDNVASAARFLFWRAFSNARHWVRGCVLPFQIYRLPSRRGTEWLP